MRALLDPSVCATILTTMATPSPARFHQSRNQMDPKYLRNQRFAKKHNKKAVKKE